ncbi:hypothetical protein JL722_7446 [Aureococcus anophagefferens]|nr:hypothetical protein JL722_7446 [Aureococcus anophagefferens]
MRRFFSILCVAASARAIALPGGLRPRLAARAEAAGRARARVSKRLPWRRKVETPDDCEVNCDDEKEFGSFAVTAEAPMPAPAAEEPLPKWRTDYLGSLDRLGKYSDDGFTLSTPLRYSSGDWWRHVLSMRRSLILKRVRGHVSFNILWSCAVARRLHALPEGAPARAYPECLKQHLRGERDIAALTMLNNREREFLDATDNLPMGCTLAMSALLNRVKADSNEQSAKHLLWWQLEGELLHKLMGCVGEAEAIAGHARAAVISHLIEEPFGLHDDRPNMLPLNRYCAVIAADLASIRASFDTLRDYQRESDDKDEMYEPLYTSSPGVGGDKDAPEVARPVYDPPFYPGFTPREDFDPFKAAKEVQADPPLYPGFAPRSGFGPFQGAEPAPEPDATSAPAAVDPEEDRPYVAKMLDLDASAIESLPADEREQVEGLRKMYEMQAWKKKADGIATPSAPTWTASRPFA